MLMVINVYDTVFIKLENSDFQFKRKRFRNSTVKLNIRDGFYLISKPLTTYESGDSTSE